MSLLPSPLPAAPAAAAAYRELENVGAQGYPSVALASWRYMLWYSAFSGFSRPRLALPVCYGSSPSRAFTCHRVGWHATQPVNVEKSLITRLFIHRSPNPHQDMIDAGRVSEHELRVNKQMVCPSGWLVLYVQYTPCHVSLGTSVSICTRIAMI